MWGSYRENQRYVDIAAYRKKLSLTSSHFIRFLKSLRVEGPQLLACAVAKKLMVEGLRLDFHISLIAAGQIPPMMSSPRIV